MESPASMRTLIREFVFSSILSIRSTGTLQPLRPLGQRPNSQKTPTETLLIRPVYLGGRPSANRPGDMAASLLQETGLMSATATAFLPSLLVRFQVLVISRQEWWRRRLG